MRSRKICGIYYLWDGAEVLYIGKSENIRLRVSQHRADHCDFAGYFIDECPAEELDEREAKAIAEFKPRYNVIMQPFKQGANDEYDPDDGCDPPFCPVCGEVDCTCPEEI